MLYGVHKSVTDDNIILNFLILLAKFYVYKCKVTNSVGNFGVFMLELKKQIKIYSNCKSYDTNMLTRISNKLEHI